MWYHYTMTNHTMLNLGQARDLAAALVTRYFDAETFLDGARDAQMPEYYEARSRFSAFVEGASFAFHGRNRDALEHDVLYAYDRHGPRPKRGEGRTEWMGRMIDSLTNVWGVTNATDGVHHSRYSR